MTAEVTQGRTRRQVAGIVAEADDEHVRPLPLAIHRQLRKHGADLAMLARASDPELAGLVVRRVQDELLGGGIVLRLQQIKQCG